MLRMADSRPARCIQISQLMSVCLSRVTRVTPTLRKLVREYVTDFGIYI